MSPMTPPGGPVIETLAVPNSRTLALAAAPNPKAGSTQAGHGGGVQQPVNRKSTLSTVVPVTATLAGHFSVQLAGTVLKSTVTLQGDDGGGCG